MMMAAGLCSAAVLFIVFRKDDPDGAKPEGSAAAYGDQDPDRQTRRFRAGGSGSGQASGAGPGRREADDAEREPTDVPPGIPAGLEEAFAALEDATEEERAGRLLEIAGRWMAIDPKAALAWAFKLESGSDRAVIGMLLGGWGRSNPQAAFEALQTAGASRPDLREFAERLLFDHWASADPSAAWDAVGQLADGRQRAMIESGILQSLSQVDPSLTAERLSELSSTSAHLDELIPAFEATAGNLAASDPRAAATWAMGLPDGSAREAAVSGVIGVWLYQDYEAAAAWVRSLPEGDVRDSGVDRMVAATRNRNPQEAFRLAEGVSDPGRRSRLLSMVSLGWLASEPDQARVAIENSSALSAEQKALIIESHRGSQE